MVFVFYQHTCSSLWKFCFVSFHNPRLKLLYFLLISSPNLICKWNMKNSIYSSFATAFYYCSTYLNFPQAPRGLPNTAHMGIQFLFNSGFARSHVITCIFNYSSLKRWQLKLLTFPWQCKAASSIRFSCWHVCQTWTSTTIILQVIKHSFWGNVG